ncbi:MAG: ROK family protein [Sphingomonadaceae bacterium]|nr:ROK family protein [Sphingomonadaceae bacterium]
MLAAVEAGGTKFLCALVRDTVTIARMRIVTADPDATFAAVAAFFADRLGPIAAAGVASFGPIDLDPASPGYGRLTTTPKPGWSGVDLLGRVRAIVGAPVAVDTDVNAAAVAEARAGGIDGRLAYVTVGTGIGVGVAERGRPLPGAHAEGGHIRVPRAPDDAFAGTCPWHGDCLEGLAAGPALAMRWGVPAEALAADHPAWAVEAHYLAALCLSLTYLIRPERIVLGGGVAAMPGLHDRVRARFAALAAGYALDRHSARPAAYIVPPRLADAGLHGALLLAEALADPPSPAPPPC